MPESRTIKLQILTPLWTGGVDGTSEVARATGVIGSLRWWYEAIQRAFGHRCCDPSNHEPRGRDCACDGRGVRCNACATYGATGIIGSTGNLNVKPRGNRQNRGWYLGPGLTGQPVLRIVPLRRDADVSAVVLPLKLVAGWSALGARTQIGYGVVRLQDGLEAPRLPAPQGGEDTTDLPTLRDMFFSKVGFEVEREDWWRSVAGLADLGRRLEEWVKSGSVPIAPAMKDWLRFGSNGRSPLPGIDPHHADFVFGKVQRDDRIRSRLCISCAYRRSAHVWEFRVWGWLPRNPPSSIDRDQVLAGLKAVLSQNEWHQRLGGQVRNIRLAVWREFDSERDTVARYSNIAEYLAGLLSADETMAPSARGRNR
jgi:CRISPR-associated protein Cmr1